MTYVPMSLKKKNCIPDSQCIKEDANVSRLSWESLHLHGDVLMLLKIWPLSTWWSSPIDFGGSQDSKDPWEDQRENKCKWMRCSKLKSWMTTDVKEMASEWLSFLHYLVTLWKTAVGILNGFRRYVMLQALYKSVLHIQYLKEVRCWNVST